MPKALNDSSIKLFAGIGDADVSETGGVQQNGKDDGFELTGGNEQKSKSKSLPPVGSNNIKAKTCKRLWMLAQDQGKDEDKAPPMKIDDPIEAANSSVWHTMGIKNEKMMPFAGFSQATDPYNKRSRTMDGSMAALMANPAASSRSANFHESI